MQNPRQSKSESCRSCPSWCRRGTRRRISKPACARCWPRTTRPSSCWCWTTSRRTGPGRSWPGWRRRTGGCGCWPAGRCARLAGQGQRLPPARRGGAGRVAPVHRCRHPARPPALRRALALAEAPRRGPALDVPPPDHGTWIERLVMPADAPGGLWRCCRFRSCAASAARRSPPPTASIMLFRAGRLYRGGRPRRRARARCWRTWAWRGRSKRRAARIELADGGDLVHTRMYRGAADAMGRASPRTSSPFSTSRCPS